MSESVRASLPGEALARITANAGAFVPAKAQTQMLALVLREGFVEARGTDGYAAGVDFAPATVSGGAVSVALSRGDLAEIETTARASKKELVTLTVESDSITLGYAVKGEPESISVDPEPYPWDHWAALDALLSRDYGTDRPEFAAFDPLLFARLAKVRAEGDRVMDLWFSTAEHPVLAKIGETFRGLVMPLQRQQAQIYSPEGLW